MTSRTSKIISKAIELLKENPDGLRYSELVRDINAFFPDYPRNTVHGIVWNLDQRVPDEIEKIDRGLFRHVCFRSFDKVPENGETIERRGNAVKEEDFYQPFADFLETELEECTRAIPLGGNRFRDRWGTPDVIGVWRTNRSDLISGEIIVSAEIKLDSNNLITAFGQACSYKLFSHKVYLVVPKDSSKADKNRIEALCFLFGIGLIFFNSSDSVNPDFEIRVRPIKGDPDMYYINRYIKLVEKELFR